MPTNQKAWYSLSYLAYAISIVFLAINGRPDNFAPLIFIWSICFICFFILLRSFDFINPGFIWWLVPLIIKLVLIFISPQLSNDFIRFWWDGYLSCHGINPYLWSPHETLQYFPNADFIGPLQKNYGSLNSQEYHTVYPPLSQLLYYLNTIIAGEKLLLFSIGMKFFYLMADIVTLFYLLKILKQLNLPLYGAFLYFGNPLCLIELQGNLHTEQFMLLFLVMALYYSMRSSDINTAWTLAGSVLSKMNSLLLTPLFVNKNSGLLTYLTIFSSAFFALFILYLPTANSAGGFANSIGLYFQKFEFNSLFYYIMRDLLFEHKYYISKINLGWILLACFGLCASMIYLISFFRKNQGPFPFSAAWWILVIFYCLSTTVHPWYICPLIIMGIFYLPVSTTIWSFFIFLSYSHYDPEFESYYRILSGSGYLSFFVAIYLEQKGKIGFGFCKRVIV
ncbi:MAG: hypothetical protein IPM92_08320 [Saprospiraceae bacterium]|nr:hypothetical protein [Saprospiraceae bacterium]